ncbi:MAG: hypothetical protein ACTSRI_09940 [Promethearchaeota archaeon]
MVPTAASQEALSNLRVLTNYEWYIIPLLAIVLYIYGVEIKKAKEENNWNTVFAGLTVFGMDLINEIWNALIFTGTQYSAFWTTPGRSSYIIMIGWNLEIAFMFSISGIVFAKFLPEDKKEKILGIPNRWAMAIGFSVFCVFVEVLLNAAGALIWEYPWWEATPWGVILIFFIGYFHFYIAAHLVHDMKKMRSKLMAIGVIYGIGLGALLIFLFIPTWVGLTPLI